MKDKENQIEEMTKVIRPILENRTDICFIPDLDKPIAEELLKHYQPKLPKDSIVLSREEYEAHKKLAEAVYEGGAFDHYDNVIKSANILFKERKNFIEDTRKETAEKILFKFESAFAYYDNEDMFSKKAIFECLEEIVKSIGVEIKE